MTEMSPKYKKYAQGFTKHLRHPDVEKRRRAARMVGELGAAEAIEKLLDMAENDPDPIVRKNATYSLGMFAAFRNAMDSEDEARQDAAADAITRVMRTGQIGKPAKPASAGLRRTLFSLVGVLVLLLAANAAVLLFTPMGGIGGDGSGAGTGLSFSLPFGGSGGGGQRPGGRAPSQNLTALVTAAQQQLDTLTQNANTLEALYNSVDEAGVPGLDVECRLNYSASEQLTISEDDRTAYPQIAALYDEMNATREQFVAARTRIEQACFDELPLAPGEADAPRAALTDFRQQVGTWRSTMEQALIVPTDPPPPSATSLPSTAEPTPVPTNTLPPVELRPYIADVQRIIDQTGIQFVALGGQTGGARAPAPLLEQYWQEALNNAGATSGCANPNFTIPGTYTAANVSEYDRAVEQYPTLELAITQLNAGLDVLRAQSEAFEQACAAGDAAVRANASVGLDELASAKSLMLGAADQLEQLLTAPQ